MAAESIVLRFGRLGPRLFATREIHFASLPASRPTSPTACPYPPMPAYLWFSVVDPMSFSDALRCDAAHPSELAVRGSELGEDKRDGRIGLCTDGACRCRRSRRAPWPNPGAAASGPFIASDRQHHPWISGPGHACQPAISSKPPACDLAASTATSGTATSTPQHFRNPDPL